MALGAILGWSWAGAAAGLAFGLVITSGMQGRADVQVRAIIVSAFALVAALLGAATGARIIRTTGRAMLAGAVLGGIAAIIANGNGKAAMSGAPIGTIIGLVCGLAIERRSKKAA